MAKTSNRLTQEQRTELIALRGSMSMRAAARKFEVTKSTINYYWYGGVPQKTHPAAHRLTPKQREELMSLRGSMSMRAAGLKFGIADTVVARYYWGKLRERQGG